MNSTAGCKAQISNPGSVANRLLPPPPPCDCPKGGAEQRSKRLAKGGARTFDRVQEGDAAVLLEPRAREQATGISILRAHRAADGRPARGAVGLALLLLLPTTGPTPSSPLGAMCLLALLRADFEGGGALAAV